MPRRVRFREHEITYRRFRDSVGTCTLRGVSTLFRPIVLAGVCLFPLATSADAATWSTPRTVAPESSTPQLHQSQQPVLGVDAAGRLTAAWVGDQGGVGILAASRTADGAWSPISTIANNPVPSDLKIAASATGHAALSWSDRQGPLNRNLTLATRPPGGAWSTPSRVQPSFPDGTNVFNLNHDVAVDDEGTQHGFWYRLIDEPGDPLLPLTDDTQFFSRTAAGAITTSSAPAGPADLGKEAEFAVDGKGNALVVFLNADQRPRIAFRAAGSAEWSAPAALDQPGAERGPYSDASVAINASGQAVIALARGSVIQTTVGPAAGPFGPLKTLAEGGPWDSVFDLSARIDAAGRATVAWSGTDVDEEGTTAVLHVTAASSSAAGTWTAPARLAGTGPDDAEILGQPNLRLAVGTGGDVAVAWETVKGDYVAVKPAAGAWESPQVVVSDPTGAQAPALAVDPKGIATVLWQSGGVVSARSASISGATIPGVPNATRRVIVKATLVPFGARSCPPVRVTVGSTRATLESSPVGGSSFRCGVNGAVTLPPSTKLGSTVPVVLQGSGLLPTILFARVVN